VDRVRESQKEKRWWEQHAKHHHVSQAFFSKTRHLRTKSPQVKAIVHQQPPSHLLVIVFTQALPWRGHFNCPKSQRLAFAWGLVIVQR
jgi:hypothetical protein